MSTKVSGGLRKRSLTTWNHKYVKKESGEDLQPLFLALLDRIGRHLHHNNAALYLRDRGRLLLLLSYDRGTVPPYRTIVSLGRSRLLLKKKTLLNGQLDTNAFFSEHVESSLAGIPLRSRQSGVSGLLLLTDDGAIRISRKKLSLIQHSLSHLTTLMTTVGLIVRERLRSSHLALINSLCQEIEAIPAEQNLYERIVQLIQSYFHYDHVGVYLIDRKISALVLQAHAGKYKGRVPAGQTIPIGQGIVSWVFAHGKSLMANDVSQNPYFLNLTPDIIPTQAELCVPIRVDEEIIGVLNIEHSELLWFEEDDTNAVELLADRIAVAIKKFQLYSELQKSHARLEGIVSSMGQGLMIIDRNFRIQWMNRTMERWGYKSKIGEECFSMYKTNGTPCGNCPAVRTFADGGIHRSSILSPGLRHLDITSAPVADATGAVTNAVEVIDDVTAAVAARNELEGLRSELGRSQQLASIGEVAANVVHEIRNSLNAMSQAVELLEGDQEVPEDQRQLIDVFRDECARLNEISTSYLSLTDRRDLRLGPHDLKPIVEAIVTLLCADQTVNRRIRFVLDFPKELPQILLDVNAVKQVFWNLLLNSVESIEGEGTIEVRASHQREGVTVTVSDTGKGIPQSLLPAIFEPFHSSKPGGTGLGLPIVKRIVTGHGWNITAQSVEGRSTIFTISMYQG